MRRAVILALLSLTLAACGGSNRSGLDTGIPSAGVAADLALLDTLPPPDGVDGSVWDTLKRELARQLEAKGQKAASDAPLTDASASLLSLDQDAQLLSWGLSLQGDYDQNGEVNIGDLTPLGGNFLASDSTAPGPVPFGMLPEQYTPFGYWNALSVVDGDGNGEINLADVSALGANFGRAVTGYRIYAGTEAAQYPASNAAPAKLAPIGELELASAVGEPVADRLRFSFAVPPEYQGMTYWVRPFGGGAEGTPSNTAGAALNYPPNSLGLLGVAPAKVEPGEVVTLEFSQPVDTLLEQITIRLPEDLELPLGEAMLASASTAYFVAPLLTPGLLPMELWRDGVQFDTFTLEILAATPTTTMEQLPSLIADSVEGIKAVAQPGVIFPVLASGGVDHAAIRAELDKTDGLADILEAIVMENLAKLEPLERQQFLGYLEHTEVFAALGHTANAVTYEGRSGSKFDDWQLYPNNPDWVTNFNRFYYDAKSASITNRGMYYDAASIGLGALNPWAGFAWGAMVALVTLERQIIDLAYPTDLKAVELASPYRNLLDAGADYQLRAYGRFFSEKAPTPGQTLQALLSTIIEAIPLPGYWKVNLFDACLEMAVQLNVSLGVTLALDTVLPTAENPDNPYEGHVDGGWLWLDPYLYHSDSAPGVMSMLGIIPNRGNLDMVRSYYRSTLRPIAHYQSNTEGDFIDAAGASYEFTLLPKGEAGMRFNKAGRHTLFFRGLSFKQSKSSVLVFWNSSHLETFSKKIDFWVGKHSDWNVHTVIETVLGEDQFPGGTKLLVPDDYPLVLANLNDYPSFISASLQSGAAWGNPQQIAPDVFAGSTGMYAGYAHGLPVMAAGTNLIVAQSPAGISWPDQAEDVSISLPCVVYGVDEGTAVLTSRGGSYLELFVTARNVENDEGVLDPLWDIRGYASFIAPGKPVGSAIPTVIAGRPAAAFTVRTVEDGLTLQSDVYYMIADDNLGKVWGEPVLVATSTLADGYFMTAVALAETGGRPCILLGMQTSFRHYNLQSSYDALFITTAQAAGGGGWPDGNPAAVHDPADWSYWSSIEAPTPDYPPVILAHSGSLRVGPTLGVSFTELLPGGPVVHYTQSVDGTTWSEPEPVAVGEFVDQATLSDGEPGLLVFLGTDPRQLLFARP